ncbi:MAG: hypothetical protein IKW21_05855, partial [Lachnospiraceae bacterium]|nr:hypothetical protein [Lachnospiraceae bacterium]
KEDCIRPALCRVILCYAVILEMFCVYELKIKDKKRKAPWEQGAFGGRIMLLPILRERYWQKNLSN